MKIGIMGAMPQEMGLLRDALGGARQTRIANRDYHEGTLAGHDVVVVFSRWGKVAAASTSTTLLNHFGVELIIFTGVAGGVDPALEIGDVVIADRLMQHDFDASAGAMFPKFEIPLLGISHFAVEQEYVAKAVKAAEHYLREVAGDAEMERSRKELCPNGARVHTGLIASGDQFIADAEKIAALRDTIEGLLCIEMEGAAVAQICHEHGAPCIVIRSISDKADHAAPADFVRFVTEVASHYSHGIVTKLLGMI